MTTALQGPMFEVYRARRIGRQRWRWRAIARNGRVIAASADAYVNPADAIRMIAQLVLDTGLHTPVMLPADAPASAGDAVAAMYRELEHRQQGGAA